MTASGPARRSISVTVQGVPPKKDSAMSLWGKPAEIARLKALRAAVHAALGGGAAFTGTIRLQLTCWAKPRSGGLDAFLAGIIAGLGAKHPRTYIAEAAWADVPPELHPDRPVAFTDDVIVTFIEAERRDLGGGPERYELTLEELA